MVKQKVNSVDVAELTLFIQNFIENDFHQLAIDYNERVEFHYRELLIKRNSIGFFYSLNPFLKKINRTQTENNLDFDFPVYELNLEKHLAKKKKLQAILESSIIENEISLKDIKSIGFILQSNT